jgi:hypothetical protein
MIQELGQLVTSGFARVVELLQRDLNLSWITPKLAVGGAFNTAEVPRLRRMGIGAVVDCREEACDDAEALDRQGIAFLHLPTPDNHQLTQESLDGAFSG